MFFERLNALCKEHNMSVSVFVRDVLKLSSSSATGWKKGATPNSEVVLRTAKYFNVSTDFLLGITDIPNPGESVVELQKIIDETNKSFYGYSPKERFDEILKLLPHTSTTDQTLAELYSHHDAAENAKSKKNNNQEKLQIEKVPPIVTEDEDTEEMKRIATILKTVPPSARSAVSFAVCNLIEAIYSISEAIYQSHINYEPRITEGNTDEHSKEN